MKRLLATLTLILCLSFPVFAGHVQGGEFCSCNNPESHNGPSGLVRDDNQEQAPVSSFELGLVLIAVLLYLKSRA